MAHPNSGRIGRSPYAVPSTRRIASSISRSFDTRAMPPVGPVRKGKAQPLPTKSSLIPLPNGSVDLDHGALDGNHGAPLELGCGVRVQAHVGALHRHLGRALRADLDTLDLHVAAAAVDLDSGVGLQADLLRL